MTNRASQRQGSRWAAAAVIFALTSIHANSSHGHDLHAPALTTLSSPAPLTSGGDSLVRLGLPAHKHLADFQVSLNGNDITNRLVEDPASSSATGLVTNLDLGSNVLTARLKDSRRAGERLVLVNHPISGPLFSGPHQDPFICTTEQFKLYSGIFGVEPFDNTTFGPSLDSQCSAATKITYIYMPRDGKGFRPLANISTLPDDVGRTTTITGTTVNFIVRVETTTIDRGIYQSTVLHDPTHDPQPSWQSRPPGWNRRLIAVEGAGCPGGWYHQGTVGPNIMLPGIAEFSLFSAARLGEGYALFGNTLQNASQSCNAVLAGEAALMSKEHFIKTYGVPEFTVSAGASGGSYGSSQLADALPGLFDGILIASTFPDPLGIAFSAADGHLLTHYFAKNPGALSNEQLVNVSGYKSMKALMDAANQASRIDPVPGRSDVEGYQSAVWNPVVPESLRYDPVQRPRGARPTLFDDARNIYGIDSATGFAKQPLDNVGVQYGLKSLLDGVITPQQFLDLNEKIGGYDADLNYVPHRVSGDLHAIARAYESGLQLSGGGGLGSIPILDITGSLNEDGGYHYQWYHFAERERLSKAVGDATNEVMWRGNPVPFDTAWATFIAWVQAKTSDHSSLSERDKTLRHKPDAAVDGCWSSLSKFVAERQVFGRTPETSCNQLFPSYAFPRYMAGGPLAADIIKCSLKPLERNDYAPKFSDEQWQRLSAIFPSGVCDWSKPGVEQRPLKLWVSPNS